MKSEVSIHMFINGKSFAVDAAGDEPVRKAMSDARQFIAEVVYERMQQALAPKRRKRASRRGAKAQRRGTRQ